MKTDFLTHLKLRGLPEPEPEYEFDAARAWRFDFAWPREKVAAEREGGTWTGGRHTRGKGFEEDCRKYNYAALAGWVVLRFTSDMIDSGEAVAVVAGALGVSL